MTASHFRASEVLGHFVEMHVAMIDLDKQLHWALQPDVQAPDASGIDDDAIVQIAQRHVCKIACNIDPLRGLFASNSDPL